MNALDVINSDKVVGIHFTLRDEQGKVLETSADRGPLYYLPGTPKLPRGLHRALLGHHPGDFVSGTLEPKDGYGDRQHPSERVLSRRRLPDDLDLETGMRIALQRPDGTPESAWIRAFTDDSIVVDLNHPYAGRHLRFDAFVLTVRDTTTEERRRGLVDPRQPPARA